MTPAFALPLVPFRPVAQAASLPIQAASFETLLSVSSGTVAHAPVLPVALDEAVDLPPVVMDNQAAIVTVREAEIDPAIQPWLAAYAGDPAPISISVVSPAIANDAVSDPEVECDNVQPAQHECSEMVVPVPIVDPTPIPLPAKVTYAVAPVALPTAPLIAQANQPPRVALQKNGPPAMEPDFEFGHSTQAASVQTASTRQITVPALPQTNQEAPLPVSQAGAAPMADLVALLASTSTDNNPAASTGFQAIMADRVADTAIRPVTDASAIVAERALDVARGSLWLDQLAGDIAAVKDHDRDLAFRLIPAQLGQLDVKIATSDDGMQLNFSTQTDEAARIIGSAQSRLVEELRAQGVRVAGSEVNAGSGQPSFAQQNGQSAHAQRIAEFERPSPQSLEPTHASGPQNGRFA